MEWRLYRSRAPGALEPVDPILQSREDPVNGVGCQGRIGQVGDRHKQVFTGEWHGAIRSDDDRVLCNRDRHRHAN